MSLFRSASDRQFLRTLNEFIADEKERICCSDDQRYVIYSAAFAKVIDYATSYKTILTAIKKEYDDFIASVKMNARNAKFVHGKNKAVTAQPTSLMYFQKRAAQLQERIAIIQRNTAEYQAELKRFPDCEKKQQQISDDQAQSPIGQILGLTLDEMLNPSAITDHLGYLKLKRDELLKKKKNKYVPNQIKFELGNTMRADLDQRDALALINDRLRLRYDQMTSLTKAIDSWEKLESHPTLLEFLSSELERVLEMTVCKDDKYSFNMEVFEEDDPAKVKENMLLEGYIARFTALLEEGQYEAAASHAAKSPHEVLKNMETVERFRLLTTNEGEPPPLLLYFRALMISAQPRKQLLGKTMSVEAVHCALRHGCIDLVTFWVTQHRLTYSEALGDVIYSHGDEDPRVADTCLALAHIVYTECSVLRKVALSMCKRGMTHLALDFIYQNKNFTLDDCMFVLRGSQSLDLLQDLTRQHDGRPALLSVGFICCSLLNTDQEDRAFQLLEAIYADGKRALEKTILDDEMCSAENWSEIATRCEQKNWPRLAQEIISTLLSQSSAMCLSPGIESARLMEHVFM